MVEITGIIIAGVSLNQYVVRGAIIVMIAAIVGGVLWWLHKKGKI